MHLKMDGAIHDLILSDRMKAGDGEFHYIGNAIHQVDKQVVAIHSLYADADGIVYIWVFGEGDAHDGVSLL